MKSHGKLSCYFMSNLSEVCACVFYLPDVHNIIYIFLILQYSIGFKKSKIEFEKCSKGNHITQILEFLINFTISSITSLFYGSFKLGIFETYHLILVLKNRGPKLHTY